MTQPDKPIGRGYKLAFSPIKQLAQGLNLQIYQPVSLKDKDVIDLIKSFELDLIVVVAFGKILPNKILTAPKFGTINLHPSLLPKYRGPAPINWPIIMGEKKTGLTVMYVSEALDSGDIILQEEIIINDEDTVGTLSQRLSLKGAELLIKAVDIIENGIFHRIKQDDSLSTYFPRINKEDGLIDWRQPAIKIHNLIRGLTPDPGVYTYINGKRLKVWQTVIVEKQGFAGEVLEIIKHQGIVVGTGKDSLLITEVQPENKQKMLTVEYLLGHKIEVGKIIGNFLDIIE